MEKVIVFIASIVLLPFISSAEATRPGAATAPDRAQTTGVFSNHLGCMNRVYPPIARRLNLDIEEGGTPETDTSIFYGSNSGTGGFFTIRPNMATFDNVPLYSGGQGLPGYPLSYTDGNGGEYVSHYYVEDGRGRSSSLGYPAGNMKENNPGVPFYPLGERRSRVDNSVAIGAIASELVPAIEGMPNSINEFLRYLQESRSLREGDRERYIGRAREALCVCMQTNEPSIVQAARGAANQLNINDDEMLGCQEPLVSEFNFFNYIMTHLVPQAQAKHGKNRRVASKKEAKFEIKPSDPPLSVRLIRKKDKIHLKVCGMISRSIYDVKSQRLISQKKSCSKKEMSTGGRIANLEKWVARITDDKIMIKSK